VLLARRLALSGDFADLDWTDRANAVPDNARPFKATASEIVFEIIGRDATGDGANEVDVGSMVVDAWVGYEGPLRDPADPTQGRTIRRGLSVVEAEGTTRSARIRLVATDARPGEIGHINLTLTNVAGLASVHVRVVSGARVL
jgi:hypothetical protein